VPGDGSKLEPRSGVVFELELIGRDAALVRERGPGLGQPLVHGSMLLPRRDPLCDLVHAPAPQEGGRLRPAGCLVVEGREGGGGV
jgi:hypothetical protein